MTVVTIYRRERARLWGPASAPGHDARDYDAFESPGPATPARRSGALPAKPCAQR